MAKQPKVVNRQELHETIREVSTDLIAKIVKDKKTGEVDTDLMILLTMFAAKLSVKLQEALFEKEEE